MFACPSCLERASRRSGQRCPRCQCRADGIIRRMVQEAWEARKLARGRPDWAEHAALVALSGG